MDVNGKKMPVLNVFVLLVLIVSFALFLYFFLFPKIIFTGNVISLPHIEPHQIDVKTIINDDSHISIRIQNNDKIPYYIESVEISNCDKFNKILSIDSEEEKNIKILCSDVIGKEIKILYKRQGNPESIEYKGVIGN